MSEEEPIYRPKYAVSLADPPERIRQQLADYVFDDWVKSLADGEVVDAHPGYRFLDDYMFADKAIRLGYINGSYGSQMSLIIRESLGELWVYDKPEELVDIFRWWWLLAELYPGIDKDRLEERWMVGVARIEDPTRYAMQLTTYYDVTGKDLTSTDPKMAERIEVAGRQILEMLPPYEQF